MRLNDVLYSLAVVGGAVCATLAWRDADPSEGAGWLMFSIMTIFARWSARDARIAMKLLDQATENTVEAVRLVDQHRTELRAVASSLMSSPPPRIDRDDA